MHTVKIGIVEGKTDLIKHQAPVKVWAPHPIDHLLKPRL